MNPLRRRCQRCFTLALSLATTFGLLPASDASAAAQGVTFTDTPGKVRIEVNGTHFTDYCYTGASRPYLFPVFTEDGTAVTRRWPMQDSDDEEHDHPHHKSLWYAHGAINGVDFWSESSRAGKTVHVEFLEKEVGPKQGILKTRNHLIAGDGERVATADHTLRVYPHADRRVLDYEVTVQATDGDLTFGDTKEGSMAVRLAESMRLKPNQHYADKPTGHIINSEGVRDNDTWGKRAAWVHYYGPVNEKTVGVAIFDHPENPRHPTWWHVRNYGLFAANPFGIHDFEKKPAGTGDLKLADGDSITFRYRFVILNHAEEPTEIQKLYDRYAR